LALNKLADKTLSSEAKALLLYKYGIIRRLIGQTNAAVWNPSKGMMHFSLPNGSSDESKEPAFMTATIAMSAERIVNQVFSFTNAVWDEIEQEVEHGTSNSGEMMSAARAEQWLLSFTRDDDHQILSMMPTGDWETVLDPSKSSDTAEALQAIQTGIVLKGAAAPSTVTATATAATATSSASVSAGSGCSGAEAAEDRGDEEEEEEEDQGDEVEEEDEEDDLDGNEEEEGGGEDGVEDVEVGEGAGVGEGGGPDGDSVSATGSGSGCSCDGTV
jgi:hypothetical protein